MFGEDGADEADDRGAVGEDADDIGAAADLFVQALERVVAPQLPPVLLREAGEGEQVWSRLGEQRCGLGETRFELVDDKRVDRWFLDVDNGDLAVSRKNRQADCTFRADKALFDGIARGDVNATAAVLRGAVAVEGDWTLLVMFQRLLPGPPAGRGRRRNGNNGRRT